MDYRSDAARDLSRAFDNGLMMPVGDDVDGERVNYAFAHRGNGCTYARTNQDRLIRVDTHGDEVFLNVLSGDRRRFEHNNFVLRPNEIIDVRRNFTQTDLLPPQTTAQWLLHDCTSRIGWIAMGVFAGQGINHVAHYAAHHATQAAVATGFAGAGAAVYAQHDNHAGHAHAAPDAHAHAPAHDAPMHQQAHVPPMPHNLRAHTFDAGRDGDPVVDAEVDPRHTTWTHIQPDHPVPGTPDHPVVAPNGCLLDGTHESAGRAMLPGTCRTEVKWYAFDVKDAPDAGDEDAAGPSTPQGPIEVHGIGYANPHTVVLNKGPMTTAEKVILGTCLSGIGIAGGSVIYDAYNNNSGAMRREVDRRLDVLRPPSERMPYRRP